MAVLKIFIFLFLLKGSLSQLVGEIPYCSREGERIDIPSNLLEHNPCLSCYCKSHTVQCSSQQACPQVQGCFRLLNKEKNECCKRCLGCKLNGQYIPHGKSWTDNCQEYTCLAGVLTNSTIKCYSPCTNPEKSKDGTCCPTCNSCWYDGKKLEEGEEIRSKLDPCVKCRCYNGELQCAKKACPVLSCPTYKAKLDKDGCCPVCTGMRDHYAIPGGHCFLEKYIYYVNKSRAADDCTTCSCHDGFLTCDRQTCPPLQCPEEYKVKGKGKCCGECVRPPQTQACLSQGVLRKHGEMWRLGKCSSCRCQDGKVFCETDFCQYLSQPCPDGYQMQESPQECCPKCVKEESGLCMTFGDPHYRTFDGYLFNFQGECRYDLAYDCDQKVFSLRVINDARKSSYFTWTRRLSLKVNTDDFQYKVTLGQKLRIKVDKERVKIPHERKGLSIIRKGFAVQLSTPIGVTILWDGASYVELQLDSKWRNKTCGLCGNFNDLAADDMLMKSGILATNDQDMANSWLAGRPRACRKKLKKLKEEKEKSGLGLTRTQRLTCMTSRRQALDRCKVLKKSVFSQCHDKINVDDFYSSCIMDLCECLPSRMCECDSVTAYARACQKAGVQIGDWREATHCGGFDCPHGSMYMSCAPACRATCRNPYPNPDCHMRRCKPGCYCPPPTVLHRGACILPEKCKKWKKKKRIKSNL